MLADIESDLIEMETSVTMGGEINRDALDRVFRALHSMKGTGGFLSFDHLVRVTHAAESLLDSVRSDELVLNSDHVSALCKTVDFCNIALVAIQEHGTDSSLATQADTALECLSASTQSSGKVSSQESEHTNAEEAGTQADAAHNVSDPTADLAGDFTAEALEMLDAAESALLAHEQDPQSSEHLESAMRALHTIKGNAGFLGYSDIESLGHACESVLQKTLEDADSRILTPPILGAVDALRTTVSTLSDSAGQVDRLDKIIANLATSFVPGSAAGQDKAAPSVHVADTAEDVVQTKPASENTTTAASEKESKGDDKSARGRDSSRQSIRVDLGKLDSLLNLVGEAYRRSKHGDQQSRFRRDPRRNGRI